MAKKIEQWEDNEGCNHDTEIEALHADFEMADTMAMTPDSVAAIDALHEYAHRGDKAPVAQTTHLPIREGRSYRCRDGEVRRCEKVDVHGIGYFGGLAAIYASNGRAFEDGSEQSKYDVLGEVRAPAAGIALPEGVPPELDDWVKRWEWITARVTEDDCRELQVGDQVRIGLNWHEVSRVEHTSNRWVRFKGSENYQTEFNSKELAAITNEVRYNVR